MKTKTKQTKQQQKRLGISKSVFWWSMYDKWIFYNFQYIQVFEKYVFNILYQHLQTVLTLP